MGDCVNIYMPYETFGQHLSAETGAFNFIKNLPYELKKQKVNFLTASDQIQQSKVKEVFDVHLPVSWRDTEKDLSAWSGNNMQKEALQKLYSLEETVINSKDENLIHAWSKLQTSDHFYYLNCLCNFL